MPQISQKSVDLQYGSAICQSLGLGVLDLEMDNTVALKIPQITSNTPFPNSETAKSLFFIAAERSEWEAIKFSSPILSSRNGLCSSVDMSLYYKYRQNEESNTIIDKNIRDSCQ